MLTKMWRFKVKNFLLPLCLPGVAILFTACSEYKSRTFETTAAHKYESWHILPEVWAFRGSSGADWENNNFHTSVSISRYPENAPTVYTPVIHDLSIIEDDCGNETAFDLGETRIKESGSFDMGRTYISLEDRLVLSEDVETICVKLEANFKHNRTDETERKVYEILMVRTESTEWGPVLD